MTMDRQETQQYLEDPDFGSETSLLPDGRHRTYHEEFLHLIKRSHHSPIHTMRKDAFTINPEDTLIVVDLQEDFIPPHGQFAVRDGDAVIRPVCGLVKRFVEAGARVYCSRDYHPINHCSFESHGGMFPTHCVQGTSGSTFVPELSAAIQPHCHALDGPVFIVYKGFSPDVDSFGAVVYDDELLGRSPRVARRSHAPHCSATWTGSFLLFSSNAEADCNAPPDVMSVISKRTLSEHLLQAVQAREGQTRGKLYVVGLALDYCVMDTAVNAARLPNASELFSSVTILLDYCRPAHLHGIGAFGSGFFTDPAEFAIQCRGKVSLLAFEEGLLHQGDDEHARVNESEHST